MNPLSKRSLFGLAAAAFLTKDKLPAMLNAEIQQRIIGEPGFVDRRQVPHPNPGRGIPGVSKLLSSAEHLLFSERQKEAVEARRKLDAYSWYAQFHHSNSLSFRRARLRELEREWEEKSKTLSDTIFGFLNKYQNSYLDLDSSQTEGSAAARCAGLQQGLR